MGREGLFKRKGSDVWYAWVCGQRISTGQRSKEAARNVRDDLERRATSPAHVAADEATTAGILADYMSSRKRLKRSAGTLHHVRVKSGHLLRLLPERSKLIDHAYVGEKYVDVRLAEGAAQTTVKKELRVLKATLRLARRNGRFLADPDAVIPELEDDYAPRTRFLEPWELVALVSELGQDERAAMVTFIVATGARLGEARRALRRHVSRRDGETLVAIQGTKTKKAAAEVPVVGVAETLLDWSLAHACRGDGPLFPRWVSVNRDLLAACKRARIEPCSPNDLRRTFATWMQQAGAGTDLIWRSMRHTDGRMVERVYGRMSADDVAKQLRRRTVSALTAAAGTVLLMGAHQGDSGVPKATQEKVQTSPNALVLQRFRGAQGQNRTADTGIFNPAGNGSVSRENKRVSAERDAECAANGDLTSEPRRAGNEGTPDAPWCNLQPGGGLDEPGTLHPVALAYLASNAGYGARGRAWEAAR
jgi:integrase